MVEPRVVPRQEHSLSRRDIDPDALKVLNRLRQHDYIAYLVGGSVRDLLLERHPKDFDIGTSAHPYQIKKLFRNCWIIGRRFRLAHIRFGSKVVEVATFRRPVQASDEAEPQPLEMNSLHGLDQPVRRAVEPALQVPEAAASQVLVETPSHAPEDGSFQVTEDARPQRAEDHLIHRDNTFGTPEEDAFRRDFTINALFYDIATFSIIDYVGGLDDLRAGVVRSIGDPDVRFREDPVRMLRAVALAARLDFTIDPPIREAIRTHRHEIARSSPPRLLEEYYKILRSGAAEKTFRGLLEAGLLEPISMELHRGADRALWRSLAELDEYRRKFRSTPDTLTNALLLGSLIVPLGLASYAERLASAAPRLGSLPLARRDIERLRQIQGLQRRLRDLGANVRVQRNLTHRNVFHEALTWMEIHGNLPEVVEHWISVLADRSADEPVAFTETAPIQRRRRRRRRRRRYRPAPEG